MLLLVALFTLISTSVSPNKLGLSSPRDRIKIRRQGVYLRSNLWKHPQESREVRQGKTRQLIKGLLSSQFHWVSSSGDLQSWYRERGDGLFSYPTCQSWLSLAPREHWFPALPQYPTHRQVGSDSQRKNPGNETHMLTVISGTHTHWKSKDTLPPTHYLQYRRDPFISTASPGFIICRL